ncbi:MAG: rhodanese-like domain-containing protein [Acidimicrobiales bacterium]
MRRSRFHTALAAVALAVAVPLAGCGSDTATSTTTTSAAGAPRLVGVAAFAKRVADPSVTTVNVHIPNEGDIAGTDLDIPYDRIGASTELPTDRHTPLAIYCRSGNMSAIAVRTLHSMGYTDVVELKGGYDAWLAAGRTIGTA